MSSKFEARIQRESESGYFINGDRMVPIPNSYDLTKRFPDATIHIYYEPRHGGVFQQYWDFVKRALAFCAS